MTETQFLELFVSLSLQAAAVGLLAHWLCRLADDERVQYRLWVSCGWLLLLLVGAGILLPHLRPFHPWSALDVPVGSNVARYEMRLGSVLFAIWAIGAGVAAAIPLLRWARLQLFLRRCEPLEPSVLSRLHAAIADEWPSTVRLFSSREIATPFCVQFHRPCIVLPEHLLDFERDELGQVLRHEFEHLATGHPLHLFLQRVVETLFWFHPMVWWTSQQCGLCREFICDSAAVSSRSDIVSYLKTLLKVVERCTDRRDTPPLAFGRGKSNIARRAERLVALATQPQRETARRRRSRWLPAAYLSASLLAACLLWLPVDVFGSPRSRMSPWPTWSAAALHDLGIRARDYEVYHRGSRLHELDEPDEPKDNGETPGGE